MKDKINKRECLKYADQHLQFDLNNGLCYVKHFFYIVRTAVKMISGHCTLILYLYDREKLPEMDWRPSITVFQITALFPALEKRFGFQKDGFKVIPPNKATEISDEGALLHHCVGSYIERMAEGKTIILFIRQEQEPDKPFFTMEVKNSEVIQLHGFQNCNAPEDVEKFVEVWKKQVLNAPARLLESEEPTPAAEAA